MCPKLITAFPFSPQHQPCNTQSTSSHLPHIPANTGCVLFQHKHSHKTTETADATSTPSFSWYPPYVSVCVCVPATSTKKLFTSVASVFAGRLINLLFVLLLPTSTVLTDNGRLISRVIVDLAGCLDWFAIFLDLQKAANTATGGGGRCSGWAGGGKRMHTSKEEKTPVFFLMMIQKRCSFVCECVRVCV